MFRHYFYFGNELSSKFKTSKVDWNVVREDEIDTPFSVEKNIDNYEKNCKASGSYWDFARGIVSIIKKNSMPLEIVSLGSGKCVLEWIIKSLDNEIQISCTDYTKAAIDLVKKVNRLIDDAFVFDMLNGDYKLFSDKIVMMFRISTEFDKKTWNKIFYNCYKSGVKYIIFVPTENMTIKDAIFETIHFMINVLKGRKNTFCGYLYTKNEFKKMFSSNNKYSYKILDEMDISNSTVFLLKAID